MHLLKSLVTLSLISVLTRAVPIASNVRVELSEREMEELISRGPGDGKKAGTPNVSFRVVNSAAYHAYSSQTLYAQHGSYNKNAAVKFTKSIPPNKLEGGGVKGKQGTIYSDGPSGASCILLLPPFIKIHTFFSQHRLDYQGKTTGGNHNLQVQINGPTSGRTKSTVGGVITDGTLSSNRVCIPFRDNLLLMNAFIVHSLKRSSYILSCTPLETRMGMSACTMRYLVEEKRKRRTMSNVEVVSASNM
jgi:hypothetical protein